MSTGRVGRATVRGYRWGDRTDPVRRNLGMVIAAAIVLLLSAGLAFARMSPPRTVTVPTDAITAGAPDGSPAELKGAAADLLETTTAEGGTGYRFEIVQRATVAQKPGGREVREDRAYQTALVETGWVTPAGFYMELREGPQAPDAAVDLEAGELMFRTLVRDGITYRDDGDGWYETDRPPGIGLDPVTAAKLPTLLRDAKQPTDIELEAGRGEIGEDQATAARAIEAQGEVADIPGVIASDGLDFTELNDPVAFTFDEAGRLVGLVVTARNTNMTEYDLGVVTEITLRYDEVPLDLPAAEPRFEGADAPLRDN